MEESRAAPKLPLVIGLTVVVAISAVLGVYYWLERAPTPPPAPPAATTEPVPATPVAPPAPAAASPDADHTTPLDGSDAKVLDALSGLQGWSAQALRLLLTQDLIRHIVATVDALPREKLPAQAVPLHPVPGSLLVVSQGARSSIAPTNARRYDPYVKAAQALDMRELAQVYRHFRPQFQQAYRELGYPQGDFNARLIEVIDDLLQAPAPKDAPEVVAPGVMYHYVDPELEALPAGQKILVRVGPANEAILKSLLRQLRQAVAP